MMKDSSVTVTFSSHDRRTANFPMLLLNMITAVPLIPYTGLDSEFKLISPHFFSYSDFIFTNGLNQVNETIHSAPEDARCTLM